MTTLENYEAIEEHYQLGTYKKLPFTLVKGEGMYVWDSTGKKYLDLYGGHAVATTGHSHPHVLEALKKQADTFMFYSNSTYNDQRALYSQKLASVAQEGFTKSFFCNSGAEANEAALKIARRYTGKNHIISTVTGFHGRTIAALGATGLGSYRHQFAPIINDYTFAEFGNLEDISSHITDQTAGIIVEPIQSLAGVYMEGAEFYQGLRELCDEHGIVLIFDEVQTAPGRTGEWFAGYNWDVIPDVISTAKGIASGFPMGLVLVRDHIADTISYGEHGSTFGGGPLACAVALATLEVIEQEDLLDSIKQVSARTIEKLNALDIVTEVRGMGFLLGIETPLSASDIRSVMVENGILVGTSVDPHAVRLLPPLVTQDEHMDAFIDVLSTIKHD